MPAFISNTTATRRPLRAPSIGAASAGRLTRELDHELTVEAGGDQTVRLTLNGASEVLTANEAARFGSMLIEAGRRAGALI